MQKTLVFILFSYSLPLFAAGPLGYGAIKIDISKEAIDRLTKDDGVYLNSPMDRLDNASLKLKDNEAFFRAKLMTPLSNKPIKAGLEFSDNKLVSFSAEFDYASDTFDQVKNQLTEKYGQGIVENSRREQQCVYKNGANFKLTNGAIVYKWNEIIVDNVLVETRLIDYLGEGICPSNLNYSPLGPSSMKTLIIEKIDKNSVQFKKNENLF